MGNLSLTICVAFTTGLFLSPAFLARAAQPTVLYSTSFEAAEGYDASKDLTGQKGWLGAGSGGDGIVTNFLPNQVQSAFLGFRAPTNGGDFHAVGQRVDFKPLERGLPMVTFSAQMAVYASTTNNQGWFDWAFFNTDGQRLLAIEFPTGSGTQPVYYKIGGADYQNTGHSYSNATPYQLTVNMDFAANRWSALLDSTVLVTNQPITTTNYTLSLSGVDLQWTLEDGSKPGDEFIAFDDYRIAASGNGSTNNPGPSLQFVSRSDSGQVNLRLTGPAGATYTIDASPDLRTWTHLPSATIGSNGSVAIVDPNAAGLPARFYRVAGP